MRDDSSLAEKFGVVRRVLMLPHPRGEEESIVEAFHTCRSLFHTLDRSEFDESTRGLLLKFDELMNIDGLYDPYGQGLWLVKARRMSVDEKLEVSNAVDKLAEWFSSASVIDKGV